MKWMLGYLLATWTLALTHGAVEITDPVGDSKTVNVGETLMMECHGSHGEDLKWVVEEFGVDMELLEGASLIITEMSDSDGSTTSLLSIEDVDSTVAGIYKCQATGHPEIEDSVTITVGGDVKGLTIIEPTSETLQVTAGSELSLKCRGEASGTQWLHNGMPLQAATNIIITDSVDVNNQKLHITMLTRTGLTVRESGRYVCRDSGDILNKDAITISVTTGQSGSRGVEIIEPSGSSHTVENGQTFSIKCMAGLDAELDWFKGAEELHDQSNGFIINVAVEQSSEVKTSLLTKEDATEQDEGTYSCRNHADALDKADVHITVDHTGEAGHESEEEGPAEGEDNDEDEDEEDEDDEEGEDCLIGLFCGASSIRGNVLFWIGSVLLAVFYF